MRAPARSRGAGRSTSANPTVAKGIGLDSPIPAVLHEAPAEVDWREICERHAGWELDQALIKMAAQAEVKRRKKAMIDTIEVWIRAGLGVLRWLLAGRP